MTDKTLTLTGDQFDELRAWMKSVDGKLANLSEGQAGLDARLTSLETKVDDRLRETRPIWEQALAEILAVRHELHQVNRKLDVAINDLTMARGSILDLDERLRQLERKPA